MIIGYKLVVKEAAAADVTGPRASVNETATLCMAALISPRQAWHPCRLHELREGMQRQWRTTDELTKDHVGPMLPCRHDRAVAKLTDSLDALFVETACHFGLSFFSFFSLITFLFGP